VDGATAVPDALDQASRTRLVRTAAAVDPEGVIARSRHAA
jgi:hypothetical protein